MRWCALPLILTLLCSVQALSLAGNRLLVVLEEIKEKEKFSQLWTDLEARGFSISFQSPKDEKLSLFHLGERAFDHVALFPPKSKGLGPNLTANTLLDFMGKEGNILLALSATSPTPSAVVSLLLELDIHLPPDRHSIVVDHFKFDTVSAAEKHDVILVDSPKALRPDVTNPFEGEGVIAIPRALGQTLGNDSPYLAPIIRAPGTAYTYNPKDESESGEDAFAAGAQLSLVSSMQARNSARLTIIGSSEMLENHWFDAKVKAFGGSQQVSANKQFAARLTEWTFKETGVLKVGKLQHFLNEDNAQTGVNGTAIDVDGQNPSIYRIKNKVAFSIELSEYSRTHFIPFTPPKADAVQLEFTMLSPFHRLTLKPTSHTANSTTYYTTFVLPDQHGIFNFRVNYKRPFLTNVDEKRQVTVRHFAHDEWPRSWEISGAWVWIGGIWITVIGWLAFVALWLYSEPTDKKGEKKTN